MILNNGFLTILIENKSCLLKKSKVKLINFYKSQYKILYKFNGQDMRFKIQSLKNKKRDNLTLYERETRLEKKGKKKWVIQNTLELYFLDTQYH